MLGIPDILILRLKIAQISLCIGLSAINSVLSPQLIVFKLVLVVFIVVLEGKILKFQALFVISKKNVKFSTIQPDYS